MRVGGQVLSLGRGTMVRLDDIWRGIVVALAYYVAARIALVVGTLPGTSFAPFWPPNIVLLCALVFAPPARWWVFLLAAFLAHAAFEWQIGADAPQLSLAFFANSLVAGVNALAVRRLIRRPPWFGSLRKTSIYVAAAGFVAPAIGALAGGFVPILGGSGMADYPLFWAQWYAANALAGITLGPLALILVSEGMRPFKPAPPALQVEAAVLALVLAAVCAAVFNVHDARGANALAAVLLYAPLPIVIWAAERFGVKGASAAIFAVATVLVWRTLQGPPLFAAGTPEGNVLAVQVLLVGLTVPVLLLGSSIDETRSAERSTRESEVRMASAAASANIGLWHYDIASDAFWGSEACRALFGFPRDAPFARELFLAAIHPGDRATVTQAFRIALRSGQSIAIEFRVGSGEGDARWIQVRGQAHCDEAEVPVRVSGVFIDVTARKAAEAEAELQRRELAHLTRVSMLGELSGTLAHELHQPLTAILSNAQAAQNMIAAGRINVADVRDALADIVQEGHRAGEVIHRLRKLLRKDEGRVEPVELGELVRSTLRLLHGELVSRNVKVKIQLADRLPQPLGDPVQLQQVLLNLMMNAMEAMSAVPADRRVLTVRSRPADRGIELTVADRGRGIPAGDQSTIFQPFYSTKEHGLGLGLSICSTIVKTHGGELVLTNNREGGATAIMRLPAPAAQVEVQDDPDRRGQEVLGLSR
ncbi:MAG TPA: MASE1 domain-containing protein [Xanthobacteraceae bacterium]|nr:MASE1 domain-containing protein [Xanthobacteraceae bacterium]